MKLIERVITAVDFGKSSIRALEAAAELARRFDSAVILVHIIHDSGLPTHIFEYVQNAANERLQEMAGELRRQGIADVEIVIAYGSPFDKIIWCAEKYDANVILLGAGDSSEQGHHPAGITAQKVARKSRKPVWIIRADQPAVPQRILCPVDRSLCSRRALKNAIHLARTFKAELQVLHAIQPLPALLISTNMLPPEEQEAHAEYERKKFDSFVNSFDFSGVRWSKEIRAGKPAEVIREVVREKEVDLLIMGSTGKNGLSRLLLGSVTEKILHDLPCSLITTKSEDAIRLKLENKIESLESHFLEGKRLLEQGFHHEAAREFNLCLDLDLTFVPAIEGLAAVAEHLGHAEEAGRYRKQAEMIRKRLWEQDVEAEARYRNPLL